MEPPNIEIPNVPQDDVNVESKPKPILTRKRKSGPMNVLRVAILMMRGSPKKSNVTPKKSNVTPKDDESKNVWSKLVGSIRPLHLQSNQSPRSFSGQKFNQLIPLAPDSPSSECGASMFTAEEEPYSPLQKSPSISRYASAVGLNELVKSEATSRYASAVGLNELVPSDEENEKEEAIEDEVDGNGDEKIDAKADEFIAQFYQQMRLQRLNNVNRHYKERSQRSLGL
ncbi:unnamed protein product [Trifolium pratense]|uniref:Uncharacterized protein n=1 Tax=Trifolium pratense TaxID=57577 RepID=A0ACB0IJ32_TRIPR|nr:unnamed protein product [Trifolium pratense]